MSNGTAEPVGLIGVGLLGLALAERLLTHGVAVSGYDPATERTDLLRAKGGVIAANARDMATHCSRFVFALPTSQIVANVLDEIAPLLQPGSSVIDCTTGSPSDAEHAARNLAVRGVAYLDATVLGSSVQVRAGEAVLMVGGERTAFESLRPLLDHLGRRVFWLGPAGSGSRMKLVANLVLGLHRAVLAEGLSLARQCGLAAETVLAVLRDGPAYSAVMDAKGDKMLRGDFSPQARLAQHYKDVQLIQDLARTTGANVPLTNAHARLLTQCLALGLGELDNSAVIRAFEAEP